MKIKTVLTLLGSTLLGGAAITAYGYEKDKIPGHRPAYVQNILKQNEIMKSKMETEIANAKKEVTVLKQEIQSSIEKAEQEQQNMQRRREDLIKQHPILKHGLPNQVENSLLVAYEQDIKKIIPPTIFVFRRYIAEVDFAKKTPRWVADSLSPDQVNNPAIDRKNSVFKQDPSESIPKKFQSTNEDYWASGYHRGHMIPAGDMYSADSQLTLDETFYLTHNIVPQNGRNNSGYWRRMEQFVRKLPDDLHTTVHVVTGPLYLPAPITEPVDPKYGNNISGFIHYPVIGKNQVHVPTHLYKVILAEPRGNGNDKHSLPAITAFMVPNQAIPSNEPLRSFEIDLEDLERLAGLEFFAKARTIEVEYEVPTNEHAKVIEKPYQRFMKLPSVCDWLKNGCKLKDEDPSLEYMFEIRDATSEEELEKIWDTHIKANIPIHEWTQDAYDRKKEYFARRKQRIQ